MGGNCRTVVSSDQWKLLLSDDIRYAKHGQHGSRNYCCGFVYVDINRKHWWCYSCIQEYEPRIQTTSETEHKSCQTAVVSATTSRHWCWQNDIKGSCFEWHWGPHSGLCSLVRKAEERGTLCLLIIFCFAANVFHDMMHFVAFRF